MEEKPVQDSVEGTSKESVDDAIRDAAKKADGRVPPGRHGKRLRLEVEIEVGSPGRVTEYRAFLD